MPGLSVKCFRFLPVQSMSLRLFSVFKCNGDEITNGEHSDGSEAQPERRLANLLTPTPDSTLVECVRRNKILRSYVRRWHWEYDLEFKVVQNLLAVPTPYFWLPFHAKYPLVYDFEWETFHWDGGHGDLVLTDGLGGFLIVEAKSLFTFGQGLASTRRTNRTRKRSLARQQCSRNTKLWHGNHSNAKSTEGVVVTEEGILFHVTALERSKEKNLEMNENV